MINEIQPSDSKSVDLLAEQIEKKNKVEVFYPLWDGETADYCGTIEWREDKYHYDWGGHGIGSSHSSIRSSDQMIERVLSDNERFNAGKSFHMKTLNQELTSQNTQCR